MKRNIGILLLVLCSSLTFGQSDSEKKRSVFFELGGSGGLGSLNYESSFFRKEKTELLWRIGWSLAPIDKNNGVGIVFPVMIQSLWGERAHKMELGLGQGITFTTRGRFFILTTAALGYRFQPGEKKWFFRATYTPLISYLFDFQVQQWGGISFGYSFK